LFGCFAAQYLNFGKALLCVGKLIDFESVAFVMMFAADTSCFGVLLDHESLPIKHSHGEEYDEMREAERKATAIQH